MDLKRKEFTSKKKEEQNQSSRKWVSNSKLRSLISRVFLEEIFLPYFRRILSSCYVQRNFNGFRDFYCYSTQLEKVL